MTGRMWRIGTAVTLAAGSLLVAGCPTSQSLPSPINVAAGLQAHYVVNDVAKTAGIAFLADGRVLFTERQTGAIRVITKDGTLVADPFATVPVNYAGDRGLLGIAVHPNFNLNLRIYVFYSRSDTGVSTNDPQAILDNRVVYFEANGNVAAAGETFVASFPTGGTTRIGGRIAFARDDTLYVALGDSADPPAVQDNTLIAGKILRYHDGGTIPSDNPIADSAVYARGIRDPQGLAFDPQTGFGFFTDENESKFHEINRIDKGKDYGWPTVVGVATSDADKAYAAANADYTDPILDSGTDANPFVGLAFNPSGKYAPNVLLTLFYGLRDSGRVNEATLPGARTTIDSTHKFATGLPTPLTDLAFTPAGTLYVASQNAILRVELFP